MSSDSEIDSKSAMDTARISELLVRDLRLELEKRNLDNKGNKSVLIDRLTKAIEDEFGILKEEDDALDDDGKENEKDTEKSEESNAVENNDGAHTAEDYTEGDNEPETEVTDDKTKDAPHEERDEKTKEGPYEELDEKTKDGPLEEIDEKTKDAPPHEELNERKKDGPCEEIDEKPKDVPHEKVDEGIKDPPHEERNPETENWEAEDTPNLPAIKVASEIFEEGKKAEEKDGHKKSREEDDKHRRERRDEQSHSRRPVSPPRMRTVEIRLRSPPRHPSGRVYYGGKPPIRGRRPGGQPYKADHRLTFEDIRRARDETLRREEDRRRREQFSRKRAEEDRQRAIERRNQIELRQIELEKQKLRQEREKVEREKQELIRLEKLRVQHEREKIEREKLEIRRVQLKLSQKRAESGSHFDGYPEAKKIHLDSSHRSVPSSSGSSDFLRRNPRFEGERRAESSRQSSRDVLRNPDVELRDSRSRGSRTRERDYDRRSASRDRSFTAPRDKLVDYSSRSYKGSGKSDHTSVGTSRDYERKEFSSRGESYRPSAADGVGDTWSRNTYGTLSAQAPRGVVVERPAWTSSRKPGGTGTSDRSSLRVASDQSWGVNNPVNSGYGVSRTSPSLLTQQVYNPHGHVSTGNVASVGSAYPNADFGPYKSVPQQHHRRF